MSWKDLTWSNILTPEMKKSVLFAVQILEFCMISRGIETYRHSQTGDVTRLFSVSTVLC